MSTQYNEGNDAYNSGGGGGGGGIDTLFNGLDTIGNNLGGGSASVDSTKTYYTEIETLTGGFLNIFGVNDWPFGAYQIYIERLGDNLAMVSCLVEHYEDVTAKVTIFQKIGSWDFEFAYDVLNDPKFVARFRPNLAGVYHITVTRLGRAQPIPFSGSLPAVTIPQTVIDLSSGTPVAISDAGHDTISLGSCSTKAVVPNVNNQGSILATLFLNLNSFVCSRLACVASQTQSEAGIRLALYDGDTKLLIAQTAYFVPVNGSNIRDLETPITLLGGKTYYAAIMADQNMSSTQFFGRDAGTLFGNPPTLLGIYKDNLIGVLPVDLSAAPESSQRFYVAALTAA